MFPARAAFAICLFGTSSWLAAQAPRPNSNALDAAALGFEVPDEGGLPRGWSGTPAGTVSLDRTTFRSGTASAKLQRGPSRGGASSALLIASIPIDFTGEKIELVGYLRTADVSGYADLFMREDGATGVVALDSAQQRRIEGTHDWLEYRIELPLAAGAQRLLFGAALAGEGTAWVDDLRILVDGVPLADVPRLQSVLETDREFSAGSGIATDGLSRAQVRNLAVLARVWGFLKYHHPRVAKGELHWDFELFRVLPQILRAASAVERNAALLAWVQHVGEPTRCNPCASAVPEPALAPDVGWIDDEALLGEALSNYLRAVYRNRAAGAEHFYAGVAPGTGHPVFTNELTYEPSVVSDAGYRLLALFRYWNMVEYWFPYRDVIGEAWPSVLPDFIPVFVAARNRHEFGVAFAQLIARINDTHAIVQTGMNPLPPYGACQIPAVVRFVEGRATVVGYSHAVEGPLSGLQVGDVVVSINRNSLRRLVRQRFPYYAGSNDAAKLNRMATFLLRGHCEPAELRIRRGTARLRVRAARIPVSEIDYQALANHDKPGETLQWLTDDVAYLKLSTILQDDVADHFQALRRARGLVVDVRGVPGQSVVFIFGGRLVSDPTPFARFSRPDVANPGAFVLGEPVQLAPVAPHFDGPVAVLVDETTVSRAEYMAMALRAAPRAFVVGSTTQGADGDVSILPLPGGVVSRFSGLGVFYPDGSPTQRIGIVPDVVATPTIDGVREGRDDVLEAALRELASRR